MKHEKVQNLTSAKIATLKNLPLYGSSWEYDRKPSLEENGGKIADFFGETRFEVKIKSREPVSVEHGSVEYSRFRAAGYPHIGW